MYEASKNQSNTFFPDTVIDAKSVRNVLKKSSRFFKNQTEIVIDFSKVEYADSVALALMLHWLREAKKTGVKLGWANVPDNLVSMAALSELDAIILKS